MDICLGRVFYNFNCLLSEATKVSALIRVRHVQCTSSCIATVLSSVVVCTYVYVLCTCYRGCARMNTATYSKRLAKQVPSQLSPRVALRGRGGAL